MIRSCGPPILKEFVVIRGHSWSKHFFVFFRASLWPFGPHFPVSVFSLRSSRLCAFALNFLLAFVVFALSASSAEFKVGLVLDRGGKDDKSFNSSAYEGAMRAKKETGVF